MKKTRGRSWRAVMAGVVCLAMVGCGNDDVRPITEDDGGRVEADTGTVTAMDGGADVLMPLFCAAGRTQRDCVCDGGLRGTQTCASNGQDYDPCVCTPAADAGADAGPTRVCEPGRSAGCTCTSGASGSQVCAADGRRYEACMCAAPDAGPPLCSPSNPAGACPTGQTCMGGLCVSPCSPSAPSGYCSGGQRCVAGSCCATACDARCCTGGTFCVGPIAGANQCVPHCRVSSDCGAGSWCAAIGDDDGFCVPPGASVSGSRRCNVDSDCTGGQACTPTIGAGGVPRRPFICTDPACAPYRQCRGVLGSCPEGYCNFCGASGRCYCAGVCASDVMCGASASCIMFASSRGSCSTSQTACAPR